ncbi:MAG: carotenoid oxygenase family protein [Minicystis sp.]
MSASGRAREQAVDDRRVVEFPRIDDRRVGRRHRHTYVVELREIVDEIPVRACLRRYDAEAGTSIAQDLGPGQVLGECVLVPKGPDPAEDAGWLISILRDGVRDTSELVVFDAEAFDAPPVARVRLPQRVPIGIHGTWVPAAAPEASRASG